MYSRIKTDRSHRDDNQFIAVYIDLLISVLGNASAIGGKHDIVNTPRVNEANHYARCP